ncbi:hypothetical protein [Candidatus Borrarchaeum sp.]|uniref:hypothetical protein n=1 Tax=Candidatus Borrarchaeum sp. TaxID=2846742 RepID=UPI00257BF3F2|nr:hypothetical protein [Candidatus Borrarchaeum sp.]
MIHSIYLIIASSGLCVLSRRYGEITFDEDLIAGFLTALKDFTTEVTAGRGVIRIIDMKEYNVILVFREGVMLAAAADKLDDKNIAMNSLEILVQTFNEKYQDELAKWMGNVSVFEDFSEIMDGQLKNGEIAEVPIKVPKLIKKIPKMAVKMGLMDEILSKIGKFCDGKRTIEDIAEEIGMPEDEVIIKVDDLEQMGWVEMVDPEE